MIKYIKINNIALISQAELELGPGLTLLTGETGAGKSILVDALGFVLGARATSDLVRSGEESGSVEGLVQWPAAAAFLESHGLPQDGPEVVLRREMGSSGRSRATINGALVPVSLLRELAPRLVVVHGQHEPQGLLEPATHLAVLDQFAGTPLAKLSPAAGRLRELRDALEALERERHERERRADLLRFQLEEIDRAGLRPGEDEELRRERARQANAGRLAALCSEAYGLLYEDEQAVLARLGQVFKRIEELAAFEPRFEVHLEGRAELRARLDDLALNLRDYAETIEASPARLDEIEARLALVERLKRKYGSSADEVLAFAEQCRRELEAWERPEELQRRLEGEWRVAVEAYVQEARHCSQVRRGAARELESRAEAELGMLAMERTRFRVQFEPPDPEPEAAPAPGRLPAAWGEHGYESAEFLLSPNPGEDLRPLARIASGGELSRILLALTAAAPLDGGAGTLIFDEVDAGIGGRVAEVVGRKLKQLAAQRQVLCVTHLPQIAAFADRHYAVRKRTGRGRTLTEVVVLSPAQRVEELARMLGGETISDNARRHAAEMLRAGAAPAPATRARA